MILEWLLGNARSKFNFLFLDNFTQKISNLETKLNNVNRELAVIKNNSKHFPVAFSVTIATKQTPIFKHQTIIYDHVITNLANGYDVTNGRFVAPVKGLYHFTIILMGDNLNTYAVLEIVKNGNHLVNVHSQSTFETGSGSVVVTLDVGDMVWVRYSEGTTQDMYGSDFNQFFGFLIETLA
nr:complement C1q domain-containing protein 2 [Anadara sativa]